MENFRIPVVEAKLSADDLERIYEHIDILNGTISSLAKENDKQLKFMKKIFEMADVTQKDIDTLLGDYDYDIHISFDHVSNKMNVQLRTI